jgi:hypothetical protein
MRPEATGVCGFQLLVYAALRSLHDQRVHYHTVCMGPEATGVCGLKPTTVSAIKKPWRIKKL